jgi:chromosomal replication initiation ATPase DnaA
VSLDHTAVSARRSMREIAEEVALRHRLYVHDLKAPTRAVRISHPRQEAMVEMRAEGFSTTQIARFFGMKDHTTVLHAEAAVAKRGGA